MLPHSRVDQFHAAFERLRQDEAPALAQHRAMIFIVFAGVGASTLLYEPVIYWEDEWNELHRATMPADLLAQLKPFAANPAGREYVEGLRQRIVALMLAHGAAHLQIGRAYPYLIDRSPAVTALVTNLKRFTDPANLLNPGALGLTP